MRRAWLVAGLVFVLLALAWLLRGVVSVVLLAPIVYISWLAGVVYGSMPQPVLWAVFVLIAIVLATRDLLRPFRVGYDPEPVTPVRRGRVEAWAWLLYLAGSGVYSRWRLARDLAEQAAAQYAFQHGADVADVRQQLARGQIDMPPALSAYFVAGLNATAPVRRRLALFRRGLRVPVHPLDLDPEVAIAYLESLWEGYGHT
ncbi:MAG: hypothetical protein ACE5FI_07760 [Anaerolineales bacterium]